MLTAARVDTRDRLPRSPVGPLHGSIEQQVALDHGYSAPDAQRACPVNISEDAHGAGASTEAQPQHRQRAVTHVFVGDTLDDLMRTAMEVVIQGTPVVPTKGATVEATACVLELTDPRARISLSYSRGKIFSSLGELCWYLSGSDDLEFIQYYMHEYDQFAEADGTVNGAYGRRLFRFDGVDQVNRVIDLLRRRGATRKAVIQVFDRHDLDDDYSDVPCTCSLQFLLRDGRLHLITYMRSNDLFRGFPHDIFAFTMLQELVARSIGAELGHYTHMVGSLHIYASDLAAIRTYLGEGWHGAAPTMPAMPVGDPWPHVEHLLSHEEALRLSRPTADVSDSPYWADLEQVLTAYRKRGDLESLEGVRSSLHHSAYEPFIRERIDRHTSRAKE